MIHTNRLINEKSPYLRQHAHNPVDWYPWGDEAFKKAKNEDKPVFLSIGYSACHWCHVMAHESFENDSIAAYMNENFVNIKVDREEYPDVDHVYQTFVQMTTGRGGWPLSVFLTPDRVPVYGGTYFPDKPRHGVISFPDLLRKIHEIYVNEPDKIEESATQIKEALAQLTNAQTGGSFPDAESSLQNLFRQLQSAFDSRFGGFGSAPKFPHATDIRFLFNYYHYTGEEQARRMALFSLRKMAEGGIYDQIGGGFHRYSTDAKWLVPHFEKMLYDNALLIPLYVDAYRLTGENFYRRIAVETADFVLQELTDPQGAFHATLDADSEGEEGKFYVWDYKEISQVLDEKFQDAFLEYYNLSPGGNFEGKNILQVTRSLQQIAENHNLTKEQFGEYLEKMRRKLREIRSKRVRPGLDDKILADWNGMMITALWDVFQITGQEKYRQAAERAVGYLRENYITSDGGLAHFVAGDQKRIPGYLDDYAFFIQALLKGFETVQETGYLKLAVKLADDCLDHFFDRQNGQFYFTPADADTILMRPLQIYDSSTPAGSSIIISNLVCLYDYTGTESYRHTAEQNFKALRDEIENRGSGLTTLLTALLHYHYTPVEFVISASNKKASNDLLEAVFHTFAPNRVLLNTALMKDTALIDPALLENREPGASPVIFICYRNTCSLPLRGVEKISRTISDFGLKQ